MRKCAILAGDTLRRPSTKTHIVGLLPGESPRWKRQLRSKSYCTPFIFSTARRPLENGTPPSDKKFKWPGSDHSHLARRCALGCVAMFLFPCGSRTRNLESSPLLLLLISPAKSRQALVRRSSCTFFTGRTLFLRVRFCLLRRDLKTRFAAKG